MINWPDSLIKDLALRKCILVLGAGISMNSINAHGQRPKTWAQFLSDAINALPSKPQKSALKKLLKANDYLTACEILKTVMGRARFVDLLQNEFHAPGFEPADIHKIIFKLDSKIVITPNFDNIYDRYASTESSGTIMVKRYNENDVAESIRLNKRIIIKNHGTIEAPNQLGSADYYQDVIKSRSLAIFA
jgi:hypothetical protein